MLTDVKNWLETTGMKVAEDCFIKPPALPYIVFSEDREAGGADNKNCIASRSIRIEMYAEKINRISEEAIEKLLDEKFIEYKKAREWIDTEKFFQTIYEFNILEKF